MESLYHETNKLLQHIQTSELARFEQAPGDAVSSHFHQLQQQLQRVEASCGRLDILVSKEPVSRRAQAKYRLDQLKYDYQHVTAAANHIWQRHEARRAEERAREDLLTRRFTRNSDGEHAILMDHAVAEHNSLERSNKGLDELISGGQAALENLRQQKTGLKGVHRKMLDIANVLGMSNTVMRMVEKRSTQDKVIMLVGMAATLVFIFLVWRYLM